MNSQKVKKIRKTFKNSFIVYLRNKPKYLPRFFWRIFFKTVLTKDGFEIIKNYVGLGDKSVVINGQRYRVK